MVRFDLGLLYGERPFHRTPHRCRADRPDQEWLARIEHLPQPHGALLLQVHVFPDRILEHSDRRLHHSTQLARHGVQCRRRDELVGRPHPAAGGHQLLHFSNHQLHRRHPTRIHTAPEAAERFRLLCVVLPSVGGGAHREGQGLRPADSLSETSHQRHHWQGGVLDPQWTLEEGPARGLDCGQLQRPRFCRPFRPQWFRSAHGHVWLFPPGLRRLQWLHRYGHRRRPAHGLPSASELQQSLQSG